MAPTATPYAQISELEPAFELLSSPAAALWHPQLRKTCSKSAFPRPRAHMHAHGASERSDTHTGPHPKASKTPGCHFVRSNARARTPLRTRRGPKQGAQNREVATAACTKARTAGQTLPVTAQKHGAYRHAPLPAGWLLAVCACWRAPDGFAAHLRRGGTQGAATPRRARGGGPPPA